MFGYPRKNIESSHSSGFYIPLRIIKLPGDQGPGKHGFTAEFYTKFELLIFDLVESLNTTYSRGELSISQRRGIVTLIPKADFDTLKLTNWRLIALLNVDNKIAFKAIITTRIKKILPQLIHTDQTGFMEERFIGQNISLLRDLLEQTELKNIPGILLQLDFRKPLTQSSGQ